MWSAMDIGIIVVYLVLLTGMGFFLSKRASQGMEEYFLGGRNLPWWVIGASGMASNLDVTGTMAAISWMFMLGISGYWNLMSGHTVIYMALLMVFMGKWIRRTQAMTSAEWMELRFGSSKSGQFARQATVFAAMIGVIGGMIYFLVGTGKFMAEYVPLETKFGLPSESQINLDFNMKLAPVVTAGREIIMKEAQQGDVTSVELSKSLAALPPAELAQAISTDQALEAAEEAGMDIPVLDIPFWTEEFVCAVVVVAIALLYTVVSGYYGVVFTDLFQALLIGFIVLYVGFKAFTMVGDNPGVFDQIALMHGSDSWLNWLPPWKWDPGKFGADFYKGFEFMLLISMFFMGKSILVGFGGVGGYMAQRWLSCKNDRDAGMMSLLWVNLLSFRWFFIMGAAVIAYILVMKNPDLAASLEADPERVLQLILADREVIGAGIFGLTMASLIATGMSTFDSGVNSGAAMIVRDVYQRYIHPKASDKELIRVSYVASIAIVVISVLLLKTVKNINDIWTWLAVGLGGGTFVPMILMWYWPRMNGQGYAFGVGAGVVCTVVQRLVAPDLNVMLIFACSSIPSMVFTIIGSRLTKPTDDANLMEFYRRVRPFGLWGKIRDRFEPAAIAEVKKENRRDLFAILFTIPWQTILFLLPMLFVLHEWKKFWPLFIIEIVLCVILYFVWFRHLDAKGVDLKEKS